MLSRSLEISVTDKEEWHYCPVAFGDLRVGAKFLTPTGWYIKQSARQAVPVDARPQLPVLLVPEMPCLVPPDNEVSHGIG